MKGLTFSLVPIHPFKNSSWDLSWTETLDLGPLAQGPVHTLELFTYRFTRNLYVNLSLNRAKDIDINLHQIKSSIGRKQESKDLWCERGDSNPHGYPLDPKSSASASSATLASAIGSPNFVGPSLA